MKKIKKFLALGLALSLTFALTACGSKGSSDVGSDSSDAKTEESASNGSFRTLDEIKESGTINVGVFSDKSPFGYVDENGEYQGYDVYFARRLGRGYGRRC